MDLARASRKAQESSFPRIRKITSNLLKNSNSKTFEARSVRFRHLQGIGDVSHHHFVFNTGLPLIDGERVS
jgi:hypothetical protein